MSLSSTTSTRTPSNARPCAADVTGVPPAISSALIEVRPKLNSTQNSLPAAQSKQFVACFAELQVIDLFAQARKRLVAQKRPQMRC